MSFYGSCLRCSSLSPHRYTSQILYHTEVCGFGSSFFFFFCILFLFFTEKILTGPFWSAFLLRVVHVFVCNGLFNLREMMRLRISSLGLWRVV